MNDTKNQTIQEIIASLPRGKGGIPSATRFQLMGQLLERVGNPHRELANVLHIAGTNGKGSTASFLRTLLESQGYKVNSYTSPHLVGPRERIQLADGLISSSEFKAYLLDLLSIPTEIPLHFFQVITACAFLAFKNHPADFVILETGMGGRFDATNVIETPLATLLTPISLEHQEFLGETLSQIAFEKAHIAKCGVPLFSALQEDEGLACIREVTQTKGTPLYSEGQDWTYQLQPDTSILFNSPHLRDFKFSLSQCPGKHQVQNASLALATLVFLKLIPNQEAAQRTLKQVSLSGRLTALQIGEKKCWLDGAHNVAAAHCLSQFLSTQLKGKKLNVIFSMTKEEEVVSFLQHLAPHIENLLYFDQEAPYVRSSSIEKACQTLAIPGRKMTNLEDCFEFIKSNSQDSLVTGSLYLVGASLKYFGMCSVRH